MMRAWVVGILLAACLAIALAACGTHEGNTVTTNVVRTDDEVRIEGVRCWSTANRGSSVHAAQAAVMEALGEDITYAELVGASGLAFRMQVSTELCPSSPHSSCGERCSAGAIAALPWEVRLYIVNGNDSALVHDARRAVVESIDRGVPVQYGWEEDGVIIGYRKGGAEWLCINPYKESGAVHVETGWPWGVAVFTERKAEPVDRHAVAVAALQNAVRMAGMDQATEGDYKLGDAAWDMWLAKLESFDSADAETVRGSSHGNFWIYDTLVQYRTAAAEYLCSAAGEFDDEAGAHVTAAAVLYDRMVGSLLKDDDPRSTIDIAPPAWHMKDGEVWTPEQRAGQIQRMREAREFERQAIAEIEAALAVVAVERI